MKKTMLIMLIISISLAYAYVGGNSELVKSFDNCNTLRIDVAGEEIINEGEYSFVDCSELVENLWECVCIGNQFDLTLETSINTYNIYNITINYSQTIESEEAVQEIKLKNPDITVENITYVSKVLEMVLEGEGNKTVEIETGTLGKPETVYVNDVVTPFYYENNAILFNVSFSTKTIRLEFPTPPPITVTAPSGGGDGGGGSGVTARYMELDKPMTVFLLRNTYSRFNIEGIWHTFKITDIMEESIKIEFKSEPISLELFLDVTHPLDFNDDGIDDLLLKLLEIRGNFARIEMTYIQEEVYIAPPVDVIEEIEEEIEEEVTEEEVPTVTEPEEKDWTWTVVIALIVVVIILFAIVFWKKKKGKEITANDVEEEKE